MAAKRLRRLMGLAVLLFLLTVGIIGCKSGVLWVNAWLNDKPVGEALPPGTTDAASRLNATRVTEVWSIPADVTTAETQLRQLLERARAKKLTVAIAGGRHSMGGHTISADGIVLDM